MSLFVVHFRVARLVESESAEEAKKWADWVLDGLRELAPQTWPHPVAVIGQAGPDRTDVIAAHENAHRGDEA